MTFILNHFQTEIIDITRQLFHPKRRNLSKILLEKQHILSLTVYAQDVVNRMSKLGYLTLKDREEIIKSTKEQFTSSTDTTRSKKHQKEIISLPKNMEHVWNNLIGVIIKNGSPAYWNLLKVLRSLGYNDLVCMIESPGRNFKSLVIAFIVIKG